MLRPNRRLPAAAVIAVVLAVSAPALATAQGSAGSIHNGGVSAHAVSLSSSHAAQSIQAAQAFPSASSTVVGSVGFIDSVQCGYFWSVSRGDSVAETFSGPGRVKKAIFKLDVVSNALVATAFVNWTVSINGKDIGSFSITSGQLGPVTYKFTFPKITGGSYAVKMRVTNEVAGGEGSHTFRYAGTGQHSVTLKKR